MKQKRKPKHKRTSQACARVRVQVEDNLQVLQCSKRCHLRGYLKSLCSFFFSSHFINLTLFSFLHPFSKILTKV